MNTKTQKPATVEQAVELGLLASEFELIKKALGRTPNFTELSVYSVMWSEHCSYKNSIKWLKTLPKDGPHMLVKAGEENAGLVDLKSNHTTTQVRWSLIKVLQLELVELTEIFLPWVLAQLRS